MQQQLGDDVTFIGVAGRDDPGAMAAFVDAYGVGAFPHISDEDASIWADFGVTSQPAFAFINDDGRVEVVVSSFGEDGLADKAMALAAA